VVIDKVCTWKDLETTWSLSRVSKTLETLQWKSKEEEKSMEQTSNKDSSSNRGGGMVYSFNPTIEGTTK